MKIKRYRYDGTMECHDLDPDGFYMDADDVEQLLARVDFLLQSEFGGFYESAPEGTEMAEAKTLLRSVFS